jgi:hypothetical protein
MKIKHRIKKHTWDETMVIVVIITAALCILVLLASYIGVVGKAYSALPTGQGVVEMLSECEMTAGEGKVRCSIECAKLQEDCVLAWEGEVLKSCQDRVSGEYSCLCCSS